MAGGGGVWCVRAGGDWRGYWTGGEPWRGGGWYFTQVLGARAGTNAGRRGLPPPD